MPKKIRYLVDGLREGRWIKLWKEGRGHGEYMVQIWNSGKPEGEPDGDWAMPGIIGAVGAMETAVLQTPKPA
jgi:hypothetical protein